MVIRTAGALKLWAVTAVTAALFFAFLTPAQAETRVALVIGNANYAHAPHLSNPEHDADSIAASLRKANFAVDERKNLKSDDLRLAIITFSKKAETADVAVVYYAGHGIQAGGVNYLIPVDAVLASPGSLPLEAVQADTVLNALALSRRLRLLILDACRDNPFTNQLAAGGTRDVPRQGLAPVAVNGLNDTLVAYSAKDNTVSLDGTGLNSPFAASLAKRIMEPGIELDKTFREVRDDVVAATNGAQTPFVYGSRGSNDFYFMQASATANASTAQAPSIDPHADERALWESVADSNNPDELKSYLDAYPTGIFAGAARAKMASLQRTPPPSPIVPTPKGPQIASLPRVSTPSPTQTAPIPIACPFAVLPVPSCVFHDCDDVCPSMVTIPEGIFTMGSPNSEPGHSNAEGPQHNVSLHYPLSISQYPITFDEWDACVAGGGCNNYHPSDQGWGRGKRPVINVSWDDAQAYVRWLAQKTRRPYRLLSETEYEYAARATSKTAYYWGNAVGDNHANCNGCGSESGHQTSPVGIFVPNDFMLYDMAGNVWEWTQDCYSDSESDAPADGSANKNGDCALRVARGGSWEDHPLTLRSASRTRLAQSYRLINYGFRVARTN